MKAAFAKLEAYRVRAGARASVDLCIRASAPPVASDFQRDMRQTDAVRPLPDILRLGEGVPLRDEIAEAQRRLDHLRTGLAKLPRPIGDAFRLHRIEGMSYRQIALALDIPARLVERHVAAAALFLTGWSETL
ncbi:sigma factor-like helix-turn-helix DNA-binding protein [Flavisphingomonas formosensis]|uniref:sigma factor-like helix-turn-helix DNA-binding protein n=1 Tax=Flavisphingomonas formosensis TaxID=861534 RepID=UPI0012F78FE0|nr:sigma factor-like helix-turn-helix DNA-binding protein [Sphingomonas formosensis]